MRLFVAVDVPPISVEDVRLGGPESPAHLTLLFLGEIDAARAPAIGERFRAAVRRRGPFELELRGVGAFPELSRPRVVWIGIGEGSGALAELHHDLLDACRELALSVDSRPFVGHLTVRRLRGAREVEQLRGWMERYRYESFGRSTVTELLLKESRLGHGPAVHLILERLPLSGAPIGD